MSSITGLSSNFGQESLILAMSKKQSEQQGKQALSLLENAVQSADQVQKTKTVEGSLGANIDVKA